MKLLFLFLLLAGASVFSMESEELVKRASGVTRAWANGFLTWDDQPEGTKILHNNFGFFLKEDLSMLQPQEQDCPEQRQAKILNIAKILRKAVSEDKELICLPKRLGKPVKKGQPLNYFEAIAAVPQVLTEEELLAGQVKIITAWLDKGYLG